ncbi:MAG: hypothetical protein CFK52_14265 [Chloracidobacterium sp. CP2_5A]|nr:MAG: hypothetical protein CFK52_14265 [Chloracidobacterium sp. CP2_5A]
MHKDEVLGELVAQLKAMNIEPIGAMQRAPLQVEKRTIKARASTDAPLQGDGAGISSVRDVSALDGSLFAEAAAPAGALTAVKPRGRRAS